MPIWEDRPYDKEPLRRAFRVLAAQHDMSLGQMADKIGMTRQQFSLTIRSERNVSHRLIAHVAREFGITAAAFLALGE